MRKVRNYFKVFLWSFSDPSYYFSLLRRPLSFSFAFFFITLGLATIVTTIGWRYLVLPEFLATIESESKALIGQLPEDSVFTYSDQTLKTENLSLPYYLKASDRLKDWGMGENAVAISASDKPLSAAMTVTPNAVYFSSLSEKPDPLRYSEISEVQSFSAKRADLQKFVIDQLKTARGLLPMITVAFFIANIITSVVIGLIMTGFFSLLVQSAGWLIGVRLVYKQAFQWGLHIYPLALLVDQLSLLIAPKSHFPVINVAYIGMSVLILWYGYKIKQFQKNI